MPLMTVILSTPDVVTFQNVLFFEMEGGITPKVQLLKQNKSQVTLCETEL